LRDRYLAGKETIAELSQYTHCPPTLLYVILTPLADQTSYKLRMLRQELAIITLCCFGLTNKQIAKKLKLSEEEVREHTDAIVSDENFRLRPWYNNRVVPE
jgi:DNA-binding NarL/FixJ family response regulator